MWITDAAADDDIRISRHTEPRMRMLDRRHPRPNQAPKPAAPPTTADIERLLEWVAAEIRAERRYTWYASRCPARFIARTAPSEN